MDAVDAFEHLRTIALSLPGLARVPSWSGQLAPAKPQASQAPPDFKVQATILPSQREAFDAERDRLAFDRHGESYANLLYEVPEVADQLSSEAKRTVGPVSANRRT
jgi:hypothetical protein